jgi:hypothetical protein
MNDLVGQATLNDIAVNGTDAAFADVAARVVRIDLNDVGGTFYGLAIASLANVEIIARGEAMANDDTIFRDGFESGQQAQP